MGALIIHALKGNGKIHCVKYCPMGRATAKIQQVQVNLDLNNRRKKPLEL